MAKFRVESTTGQDTETQLPIRLYSNRSWDGGRHGRVQTHRDQGSHRSPDRNRGRGGVVHGHTLVDQLSPTNTGHRLDVSNGAVRQLLQRDGRPQVQLPPREGDGRKQRDQLHDRDEGQQMGLRQLGEDG